MENKTFIVAVKSEFVKDVTVSIDDSQALQLQEHTVILCTTFSTSDHEAIKKISAEREMPEDLLVAFELAI